MAVADCAGGGVTTAEGTTIEVGDVVVTRFTAAALATGGGWVRNGDGWIAKGMNHGGWIGVTRVGSSCGLHPLSTSTNTSNWVTHPPPTAQGHTVDAEHAYVTVSTIRDTGCTWPRLTPAPNAG